MTGLILPEIVYSVKKKLGCIFIEIHNSKPLELTEQGQLPEKRKKNTQSVTGRSNDRDTRTGGASWGNVEKAGWKTGSVQSTENRQFYETKGEKLQIICESFQLDMNAILNTDAKLKEAVIELFLDNFEVLVPGATRTNPEWDPWTQVREEFMWVDRWVVRARSDRIFSESLGMKKKELWTRWVTDLRELNKQTIKDSYLLKNIQEILHSLQGATVFSSLDACRAYHAWESNSEFEHVQCL